MILKANERVDLIMLFTIHQHLSLITGTAMFTAHLRSLPYPVCLTASVLCVPFHLGTLPVTYRQFLQGAVQFWVYGYDVLLSALGKITKPKNMFLTKSYRMPCVCGNPKIC